MQINRRAALTFLLVTLFFTTPVWGVVIQNAADYISAATLEATTEVITPSLTLNGVTRVSWPVSGNTTISVDTVECLISGTNYVAITHLGVVLYNDTSPFTCLQTALNYCTYNGAGVVTYLKGRVYNNTSVFVGPGYWDIGANDLDVPNKVNLRGAGRDATIIKGSLANAVVRNMWSNYTYGSSVEDLRLHNSANGATCLKWMASSAGLPSGETYGGGMISVHRVHTRLTGTGTYCFYFQTTTGAGAVVKFTDVRTSGGILYLERIFDSQFSFFNCGKIKLVGSCTGNHYDNFYVGGGLDYGLETTGDASEWSGGYSMFTNGRIDNSVTNWVNLGGYYQGMLFSGCTFSNMNWGTADNTVDGIVLGANTHHTTITGCRFSNDLEGDNDAAILRYVFYETAGTHDNVILGNSYEDNEYSSIPLYGTGLIYTTTATVSWETPYGTKYGVAEASDNDWIFHGLDSTLNVSANNCTVIITVQESDAPYSAQVKAVNGTKFQLYLYDIAASAAENTDKTISFVAYFQP